MKLTKPMCGKLKIHNPYNYAQGKPYLEYFPADRGRGGRSACWKVIQQGRVFSDHWRDNGARVFPAYGSKEYAFKQAIQWMKDNKMLPHEPAKTPFGTWMDSLFVALRNAEIISAIKQLELDEKEKKNG